MFPSDKKKGRPVPRTSTTSHFTQTWSSLVAKQGGEATTVLLLATGRGTGRSASSTSSRGPSSSSSGATSSSTSRSARGRSLGGARGAGLLGHLGEESTRLVGVAAVRQVGRGDGEGVVAHEIARGAKDLGLGDGVAGDLEVVLLGAGEAPDDDAGDLGLRGGGHLLDGVVDDGGALGVAAHDDGRVRALRGREVDDVEGRVDGLGVGVLGLEVGSQRGRVAVLGADALAGDLVGAQVVLDRCAGLGADDGALGNMCVSHNRSTFGESASPCWRFP